MPLLLTSTQTTANPQLANLLGKVSVRAETEEEISYLRELEQSVSSLGSQVREYELALQGHELLEVLENHHSSCKERFRRLWRQFEKYAGPIALAGCPTDRLYSTEIVAMTSSWPRVTVYTVLEQLNKRNRGNFERDELRRIVALGISVADLQQAERLLSLAADKNETDLIKEIENQKTRNWCPMDNPEYLLMEIEGNFRIRPIQEQIASLVRSPPNDCNSVLQLNMGEGKTSVITPMAVAAIADGLRLARVFVAKPQARQMHEILVSRLGGLLGRRVWHLPFARTIRLGTTEAKTISKICAKCREEGGVLLVQPEHVLSLQLMAIIKSAEVNETSRGLGQSLLNTLSFFDQHAHDLMDESDENFSPKFELIYTQGKQRPIGFSPNRWVLIQEVLGLVAKFAPQVHREMPLAIEVEHIRSPGFPRVRLLSEAAGVKLIELIAAHICNYGLSGLPIVRQTMSSKDAVLLYIKEKDVALSVIDKVRTGYWTESTSEALVLLRGLLACGVLTFALARKRWTVDYGLDRTRQPASRLAVPYRAKNVPSAASEFGQTDLKLLLTCLSFYYAGLEDHDLEQSLKHLSQSDEASSQYETWTAGTQLSRAFRTLDGLNLKDEACRKEVFATLRYSKGAIDYFLSSIALPKECSEYPSKLSASGWDIGRVTTFPTVGFSGTKDSTACTLPLETKQIEAPNQEHTNALVISNMLAERNSVVLLAEEHPGPCVGKRLLERIASMTPEVSVILDAGAQILDLSNEQIARAWLDLSKDRDHKEAAVFCDENDEFIVVDRRGRKEALSVSPFSNQLDRCLVFLDQARTLGTDLQSPPQARAAVTLCARITKDRLDQACMRMRKLGSTQAVVFCVPQEIETKIREGQPRLASGLIEVSDIIDWAISETWRDKKDSVRLWSVQGHRFERQRILWEQARQDDETQLTLDLAEQFFESEAQSLESLYQPDHDKAPSIADIPGNAENMRQIAERVSRFHAGHAPTASLDEEQEREVHLAPELEVQAQVERPLDAQPADPKKDKKVKDFIETGNLSPSNSGFLWAFQALEHTTAAAHFDVAKFPRLLRCTHSFANTVQGDGPLDAFQRDVHFVLTRHDTTKTEKFVAVLVSPYEVETWYAAIQASSHVLLRLYTPRRDQSLKPIGLSQFHIGKAPANHPIPRDFMIQLNLFAGQLYFESFQEYVDVCNYLCLSWGDDADGRAVEVDGFIPPSRRVRPHAGITNFAASPVQFLKVLLAKIRCSGSSGIERTHVGKMLAGVPLTEDDFAPRPKRRAESELEREEPEPSLFVRDSYWDAERYWNV